MIVRQLDQLPAEDVVQGETWVSRRLLLARDGVGFSFHDTTLHADTATRMWYRHHVEAVYCISGEGEILDEATGVVHLIRPGTLYVLDDSDRHVLRAGTELRVICVFNPALHGPETHDEEGTYPLLQGVNE